MWTFNKTLEWFSKYYKTQITQLHNFIEGESMPHLIFSGRKCKEKGLIATCFCTEMAKKGVSVQFVYGGDPITKEERKLAKSAGYVSTSMIGSSAGERKNLNPFIFGRIKPLVEEGTLDNRFRIIIIWDFDKLEKEQEAFRRLMEDFSDNCRMILVVEDVGNIIDPIVSRCDSFFFKEVEDKDFEKGLEDLIPVDLKAHSLTDLKSVSNKSFIKSLLLAQASLSQYKIVNRQTCQNLIRKKNSVGLIVKEVSANRFKNAYAEVNRYVRNNYVVWNEFAEDFNEELLSSSFRKKEDGIILLSVIDSEYEEEDVGYYILYFLKELEEMYKN